MRQVFCTIRPSHTAVALIAAATASAAILGFVAALFDSAGSTPWVPAERADLVAHCDAASGASSRHSCVRSALARQAAPRVAAR